MVMTLAYRFLVHRVGLHFHRRYETVWLSIAFPFPSHYLPPQNSGPCNSFYCLGHFKNVYDNDDDDCFSHSRRVMQIDIGLFVSLIVWIMYALPVHVLLSEN